MVFTRQYRVRYYEADFRGTLRPVTLLDYLQDAASGDSMRTGSSVLDLHGINMTWVLSRYHVKVHRYPELGESLAVRTWRSGSDGHFALREFEVFDERDDLLALATSSWAIVNMETKRPVRIEKVFPALPSMERRALDNGFKALPKPDRADMEKPFPVRMGDLDINRHVNNTVYAGWALETLPDDIMLGCRLSEIEISYRAEALYGDTVISRSARADNVDGCRFLHQLSNESDGRELTRLKTSWERIE